MIVHQLRKRLPAVYSAEPRVRLGSTVEIDIGAREEQTPAVATNIVPGNGGAAVAVAPPLPSTLVESTLPDQYEYEVRIFDDERESILVAAIEFVSPANKDRPTARNAFIAKCAMLLESGVAVTIIDLVTNRHFNLYADLLQFIGQCDPRLSADPPNIYAASCRWTIQDAKTYFETSSQGLVIGEPLPTLPLWLSPAITVSLELEPNYEQTCHDVWIT
jgi:hypothetical protein